MSQPLYQLVEITAKPGHEAALLALLQTVSQGTRQEPGYLQYDLWQLLDQPTDFVLVEHWPDQAAVELHRQQPHLHDFLREAPAHLARPLTMRRYALRT